LFFTRWLVESLERSGRWKNVFVQAAAGNEALRSALFITCGTN